MPFKIIRNDITKMQVDAIVNTANEYPIYSTGVDKAVYEAAGAEQLLEARRRIGYLEKGDVAITLGYQLPTKYIIHAASPYYQDGMHGEEEQLRSCYAKSLQLAKEHECRSIAFPLISTGNYRYPKAEAVRIAIDEINAFVLGNEMDVFLVVFDEDSCEITRRLRAKLESYIDENYVTEQLTREYTNTVCMGRMSDSFIDVNEGARPIAPPSMQSMPRASEVESICEDSASAIDIYDDQFMRELEERMEHMSDTFPEYLSYLIKKQGFTNAEVYKRGLISKQSFAKIMNHEGHCPKKITVLCLAVGAQLNLDETKDLLSRAGYALSPCDKTDIIFSYFIENKYYDIVEIDIALEDYGLPCLIS